MLLPLVITVAMVLGGIAIAYMCDASKKTLWMTLEPIAICLVLVGSVSTVVILIICAVNNIPIR